MLCDKLLPWKPWGSLVSAAGVNRDNERGGEKANPHLHHFTSPFTPYNPPPPLFSLSDYLSFSFPLCPSVQALCFICRFQGVRHPVSWVCFLLLSTSIIKYKKAQNRECVLMEDPESEQKRKKTTKPYLRENTLEWMSSCCMCIFQVGLLKSVFFPLRWNPDPNTDHVLLYCRSSLSSILALDPAVALVAQQEESNCAADMRN